MPAILQKGEDVLTSAQSGRVQNTIAGLANAVTSGQGGGMTQAVGSMSVNLDARGSDVATLARAQSLVESLHKALPDIIRSEFSKMQTRRI